MGCIVKMSLNLPISQFNAFAKEDLQLVCLDEARKSVYATNVSCFFELEFMEPE